MLPGREEKHRLVSFKPLGMELRRKTNGTFSWLAEVKVEQGSCT